MEWVLRSPQLHSAFGNLGFVHDNGYHINENCNVVLESILHNILTEDKYLRTYRRSINFGQNIEKDLIPLLIHAKEEKTIELLIRILVNLSIPIECLLSVDIISKTDFGRHIIFDINSLLTSSKTAYADHRATKVVVEFLKENVEVENQAKLSTEQCTNISNSLLLLRNILHIPEEKGILTSGHNTTHSTQNQILWNIFSQGVDKILIRLMTISEASNWGATMVQLIALLYKDQHVVTLHKLLNLWLDASLSESSEDNESNTSPPDRSSEDSSPMLTSDPTSDSSDAGGSGKSNDEPNSDNKRRGTSSENIRSNNVNEVFHPPHPIEKGPDATSSRSSVNNSDTMDTNKEKTTSCSSSSQSESCDQFKSSQNNNKMHTSETSDCGYGTQLENQESISTTSNEDEVPEKKPVHQKPHNPKQRISKSRSSTHQDRKRKKIVKRCKANTLNVQGLSHKTPTDDDISNVLKEFTVEFLLKGYNCLVRTLHKQILTNSNFEIDTSHFFWLVTYFLKFVTQIELDFEHICSVLSFDIVSYLTAEGVNLCELFALATKRNGCSANPTIRKLHLLVTAIREFVQAVEAYKKMSHTCDEDKQLLTKLELKMCETEDLRSLLVLLLRHYNPKYQSKQYLQDLVVTNHILLMFLDGVMKSPDYKGPSNMLSEHIRQFASAEIMNQYGLLLEDYADNGEFVNDCIFTVMHHVGGELGSVVSLFQPRILKTFTSIWKTEFGICDDWSDLIKYVINTFTKKRDTLHSTAKMETESLHKIFRKEMVSLNLKEVDQAPKKDTTHSEVNNTVFKDRWTEDEISSLTWNYMQCNTTSDVIGEVVKLLKEDGINKSRSSVIAELLNQNVINKDDYETLLKDEKDRSVHVTQTAIEKIDEEIKVLCEQLRSEGKSKFINWVQKVLLDTCRAKIYLANKSNSASDIETYKFHLNILNFEFFKKSYDIPALSPISYYAVLLNRSVPLVPLTSEQDAVCKEPNFLQLLHKLGFHMSADTGKIYTRVPNFWSTELLYKTAGKIAPIDFEKLNFSINDLSDSSVANAQDIPPLIPQDNNVAIAKETMTANSAENNFARMCMESVQVNHIRPTLPPPVCSVFRPQLAPIMSVKHDASLSAQLSESEDNNSVCEATYSSDLTRMYVSDEDEDSLGAAATSPPASPPPLTSNPPPASTAPPASTPPSASPNPPLLFPTPDCRKRPRVQ